MKKDILEHIIKSVLLEERDPAGQIIPASKKQIAEAINGGAVFAYVVKVTGTADPNQIYEEVYAKTIANRYIGRQSKYGTTKHYFVMSDPLPKKRQKIIVWIYEDKGQLTYPEQGEADYVLQTYTGTKFGHGGSQLLTKTNYIKITEDVAKWKKNPPVDNNTNLDSLESEEDVDVNNNIDNKRQEWLAQNDTENLTFPYVWYTYDNIKQPVKFTVYKETILDNVPYLYFYDKQYDIFFVMKRVDQFLPTIVKEQLNPNFTSYTWQKLWDQIDITKITPEENAKLQEIAKLR